MAVPRTPLASDAPPAAALIRVRINEAGGLARAAKLVGGSPAALCQLYRGRRVPSLAMAVRIECQWPEIAPRLWILDPATA
jgi:hypothetical protein